MASFRDLTCRIYSKWMNNIWLGYIKVIFITFKLSHASWIKASITNNTNIIWSLFGKLEKCFYPRATFAILFCSFCIDIFSIGISIIYCRVFRFLFTFLILLFVPIYAIIAIYKIYSQNLLKIEHYSHFLLHKLFFWTGGYLYNLYSFFCMISYDLIVGGA